MKIPSILIQARTIPEAFEKAMKEVWEKGMSIKTEYDNPDDPPSKDATVMIDISEPFGQPRFHRAFADGLGGLGEYVQEVVNGAHDYWMELGDEGGTKWKYTYHQRLFGYEDLDQIEFMADKLAESGYTRRAQAITYQPRGDTRIDDPPCLQRVWGRVVEGEDGKFYFNMNTHWRSRDLFKAWFENVIAITTLQRKIANEIMRRTGEKIYVGSYKDISDSLHIYGKDFRSIQGDEEKGIKNFFENLESRSFEERTWDSKFVKEHFINDGIGKGLENMLKRETEMPTRVRQRIEFDLEKMRKDNYVV